MIRVICRSQVSEMERVARTWERLLSSHDEHLRCAKPHRGSARHRTRLPNALWSLATHDKRPKFKDKSAVYSLEMLCPSMNRRMNSRASGASWCHGFNHLVDVLQVATLLHVSAEQHAWHR